MNIWQYLKHCMIVAAEAFLGQVCWFIFFAAIGLCFAFVLSVLIK